MPHDNISEIHSMREILSHINFNTVVLFDIDNTLIESPIELGSDQWFVMMCGHAMKTISDPQIAITMAIALYHEVQLLLKARAVEDITVKLFNYLKIIGIPMIAITARDACLKTATETQLRDAGINFKNDKITIQPAQFFQFLPIAFDNGIIYCAGQDKGKCLDWFLDFCNLSPKHIVMVDDKEKHLLHVKSVVEDRNITFNGLRYGYLDEKVKRLDFNAAHHQYQFLKSRLPEDLVEGLEVLALHPTRKLDEPRHYGHFFYDKANHNPDAPRENAVVRTSLWI